MTPFTGRVNRFQVGSGVTERHAAFLEESFPLPIVECQHSADLPLREVSGAIAFDRGVFQDVAGYHVARFSPLAGDLIG